MRQVGGNQGQGGVGGVSENSTEEEGGCVKCDSSSTRTEKKGLCIWHLKGKGEFGERKTYYNGLRINGCLSVNKMCRVLS